MFENYNDILTPEDVAEVLHVGKNRVYELLETGELKGFRIGRPWKIPRESLELYIRNSIQTQHVIEEQSEKMISPVKRIK